MKCYLHGDRDSVGVCTRCGKNVCTQCSIELDGKLVCKTCAEEMIRSSQASQAQPQSPQSQQPQYAAQPYPVYPGTVVVRHKEPILSLILSFFIPGLGQVYNGQLMKGIVILALYVILWVVSGLLMVILIGFCTMVLPILIWVYAMYDAYVVAGRVNRGERV